MPADLLIQVPVSLVINRPPEEVFGAFVDPRLLCQFFCGHMDGSWQEGQSITWHFGRAPSITIAVLKVEAPRTLRFRWQTPPLGYSTEVALLFSERDVPGTSRVQILETGFGSEQQDVVTALDHACGWENTLCALKAWIEHGVDLRR